MAVYKIFPEKTATLYSEFANMNTGRDEILELASYYKGTDSYVNRTLIQFNSTELAEVLETHVLASTGDATAFSASLKLFLASANELPIGYTLEALPVYTGAYGTWVAGNGKYGDLPRNSSGVTWDSIEGTGSDNWGTISNVTSSYDLVEGGGSWYTALPGYNITATQTHAVNSTHDVNIDVTGGTKAHYNGAINNAGFLLKLTGSLEFQTTRQLYLRYYSANSHTIYPPCLEVKWDDFATASGLNEITDTNAVIKIKNNRGEYTDEGKQRFELHVRAKNPVRTFSTSSNYLQNYFLPLTSYWGLRDENTEEMVIDFDTTYTKLSRASTGNYFDVYMGGLEPERYYRVLIKTTISGTTSIIDEDLVFKVVRNG
jgi:hypothetical protein